MRMTTERKEIRERLELLKRELETLDEKACEESCFWDDFEEEDTLAMSDALCGAADLLDKVARMLR